MTTVVTELTIDARGAEAGSAQYIRAAAAAQAAVDRLLDREEKLAAAQGKQVAVMAGGAQSISRVSAAWDKLRASIDPVARAEIAAQQAIERATVAADNAVKRGLATQVQAAEVIEKIRADQVAEIERVREAQDRLNNTPSVPPANDNVLGRGGGSVNTANVAAQFQDIFVTSQMGMNPLQIALQQGTQLSAVLGPMGAAGAVKSLGAAFMSLINPVSLITIGAVAAGAAFLQWLGSAKAEAKSLDQVLSEHSALISTIKSKYGEAANALEKYLEMGRAEMQLAALRDMVQLTTQLRDANSGLISNLFTTAIDPNGDGSQAIDVVKERFAPFTGAIETLREQIATGKPDFEQFYRTINQQITAAPELRAAGVELSSLTQAAADLTRNLDQAEAAVKLVDNAIDAIDRNVIVTLTVRAEGVGEALDTLKGLAPELRSAEQIALDTLNKGLSLADDEGLRIALRSEYDKTIAALAEQRKRQEEERAKNAAKEQTPTEKFATSTDDMERQIEALHLQAAALGQTSFEADKASASFDLLNAAQKAGLEITPEVEKEIDILATRYADARLELEGLQITMANETPWDSMIGKIEHLNELLAKGAITVRDYQIGVGEAVEDMVKGYASNVNTLLDSVDLLSKNIGLKGKEAFEAQKAISVARAVVAGGESIVHSYNAGTAIGGPVTGAIFAGIAAAATAAQIASIASATYQSKSVKSSGGTASVPAATGPSQQTAINLTIKGSGLIDASQLVDQITQQIADGGHQSLINIIKAA